MKKPLFALFFFLATFSIQCPQAASQQASSLVELQGLRFLLSLQYDSDRNFLKKNVYREFGLDRCYVHPDLASRLHRLEPTLKAKGLKLVIWDCYRPLAVQRAMWKILPDPRYVADPARGSNHNRGVAIDVSLAKEDGTAVPMPTEFDEFSPFAAPLSPCKPEHSSLCNNRDILIEMMANVGLKPLPTEWWHFQLPNSESYPILETPPLR